MDDKTFITAYAAQETQRINERLKELLQTEREPTEEEREAVTADIELTLSRMQRALLQLQQDIQQQDLKPMDGTKPWLN